MDNCFYCTKEAPLNDLMIHIKDLEVSTVYLFREQSYKGRCNVVFKKHVNNLHDLTDDELAKFMLEVKKVALAIEKLYKPAKINFGSYADKMEHFHMHVVPKYVEGKSFGGVFEMNPEKVYLTDEEYSKMVVDIVKEL